MTYFKVLAALLAVCVVVIAAFFVIAWHSTIDPITPPAATSFDRNLVGHGAELAAIGNCNSCHTAPNGKAFAGGLGVPTPFGTIYSTNITPDAETGIGHWSEAAFRRALREGVDRAGRNLYPAFPYDHFTLVTDQDAKALYAYFMTREPVRAIAPANELTFPLNFRPLLAGWKLLFLRKGPYRPDPGQTEAWNRGAYLVRGLAHCGACHTPRNALGAERRREAFAGGEAEGWTAYALNQGSPAPVPWDSAALRFYLRHGWHDAHGMARGPMAPVIDNLASVPESEINAIATYMGSVFGQPSEPRRRAAQALLSRVRDAKPNVPPATAVSKTVGQASAARGNGEAVYAAACANCHESGRALPFGGINLALSTGPSGPNARNVINVVLWGLPAANGQRGAIMPPFAGVLTDQQLEALLGYLRARFGNRPAWDGIANDIRETRSGKRQVGIYPAPAIDPAAATIPQREATR